MKVLRLALIAVTLGMAGPVRAQVVEVPFLDASQPTETFLWPAKDAKAVLIMIPGGEGHLGLTPARADLGGFYGRLLKPLADDTVTSGTVDVVVFDSPDLLPAGDIYPTARAAADHLGRIASVVNFYKDRYGLPIWLMGHSNGAISVAEYLQKGGGGIDGVIFSSSRTGVKVPETFALPALFLHHRQDGCAKVNAARVIDVFETL